MSRTSSACLLILFIAGCGPDTHWSSGGIFGQLEDENKGVFEALVVCDQKFHWNTSNFGDVIYLTEPFSNVRKEPVELKAGPAQSRHSSGTSSSYNPNLSKEERAICDSISDKIRWPAKDHSEHSIVQTFDAIDVQKTMKPNIFQPIKEQKAILTNHTFKFNKNSIEKIYGPRFSLSVSVDCEHDWLIKGDPAKSWADIVAPDGKCFFALDEHEFALPTGQKVLLTLRGFYRKDPQDPLISTKVNIETVSFRYLE